MLPQTTCGFLGVCLTFSVFGSYLSFNFMAELVFGKAFQMLKLIEKRYIIELIR